MVSSNNSHSYNREFNITQPTTKWNWHQLCCHLKDNSKLPLVKSVKSSCSWKLDFLFRLNSDSEWYIVHWRECFMFWSSFIFSAGKATLLKWKSIDKFPSGRTSFYLSQNQYIPVPILLSNKQFESRTSLYNSVNILCWISGTDVGNMFKF